MQGAALLQLQAPPLRVMRRAADGGLHTLTPMAGLHG